MIARLVPHIRYFLYVLQHKWYVFIECCKLGVPFAGITHDLSKFTPREWNGYSAKFFWPKERIDRLNSELFAYHGLGELIPYGETPNDWFTIAWNHHQNRNPHHWDYWVHRRGENTFVLPIPKRYLKEMIADWRAMSRKFNNCPVDWYTQNRSKIRLREEDRLWVEKTLGIPDLCPRCEGLADSGFESVGINAAPAPCRRCREGEDG